ncbi:uncharacterized protein K460DRAFT_103542 [Cucurbitaria berberidis CBS 394.84]|uniref:Uncharacterized protein n=1 Tax=Cucurbitaria berberidis CBS 394.84 TaxID=1168544 RepID=A0A9P4GGP9_9PLEO|nr:uncharacterized protein K460DRAFT_103542 [Cucurbitaria berberidis CBS 394.84]KAF1845129.1 hypothetical protein K460DRAFT_103542 [Cucurbitaria berberidis CBS 394.84]
MSYQQKLRGQPPQHWNAYRPTYGPPAHTAPPYHEEPLEEGIPYPNSAPLNRRRSQTVKRNKPDRDEEQLPQLWDTELDDLMGRTSRAYDVVVNYERDSEGGQRWSREDIALIRDLGKYIWDDLRAMKKWQRTVAEQGDVDEDTMRQIFDDADKMHAYCSEIQATIREKEYAGGFVVDTQGNLAVAHGFRDERGQQLPGRSILRPESSDWSETDPSSARRRSRPQGRPVRKQNAGR